MFKLCSALVMTLIFASSAIAMGNGDLEDNNIIVTVNGDTGVATTRSGDAEFGYKFVGGSVNVGGSVIVNGVDISCQIMTDCGNRNNIYVETSGSTAVSGTDAVVNGVRMSTTSIWK
ncbi:MAG: hypothetical protein D3906_06180 [Candidatus Electrothrix sp. AUS1_2]|nr:hypothetical protein [Candidatus Electrothrix sp. AUS1_2]